MWIHRLHGYKLWEVGKSVLRVLHYGQIIVFDSVCARVVGRNLWELFFVAYKVNFGEKSVVGFTHLNVSKQFYNCSKTFNNKWNLSETFKECYLIKIGKYIYAQIHRVVFYHSPISCQFFQFLHKINYVKYADRDRNELVTRLSPNKIPLQGA